MKYLHDGLYTAVGPLRLHLKPQHIFGTHLALGVQHAALDIPLHLHAFTCGTKRQTQREKSKRNIREGCQTKKKTTKDCIILKFLLPVVLFISLDSFGMSYLVLEISAVEISAFSLM